MKELLYRIKRKIINKYRSLRFKYKNDRYAIAFRKRKNKLIFEKDADGDDFILIKSTIRYWMADPFLFNHNGKNYLFAELFDKKNGKGVLACALLKNNKCGRFHIILKENFHLSYPCVFSEGNDIYMIPETADDDSACIYRALDFPKKWVKEKVICNVPCVDTTPFVFEGEKYFFTTVNDKNGKDDNLFLIDKSFNLTMLLNKNKCLRSAGNVICHNNRTIRPVQDDTVYGDAVVFSEITNFDINNYSETPFLRILPPGFNEKQNELSVKLINNPKNIRFNGLHTYNYNDEYEVIDLRYPRIKK